ncbi:MAG: cobalamin-binding protein [Candidatus Bathyarchaeota archaeon]|nr:cobalamin-binding protein [Candidatus Bathyarchaeota archaeon]
MKDMQKNIIIVTVVIIVVVLAALTYGYYSASNPASHKQESITVVDDQGYQTTLTGIPQRIVSLAPSVTPILFELGVGDKVVGVTKYDDYPYNFSAWFEAGNMTCVGGFSTPNMEAIASLNPDLIFSTNINDASIPNMRELGYKVIVVGPTSIEGIYRTIALIGKATGTEDRATQIVQTLNSQISDIEARIAAANITQKPTVYYEVWCDASGIMSAGSGSWINDVISRAGGINIFANESQEYLTTSSEVIVQRNPSVILLPTNMGTGTPFYGSVEDVKARPGWSAIDAVKNNRIYIIDQDLFNEPGCRVADQVRAVAASLYPQLFNSTPNP